MSGPHEGTPMPGKRIGTSPAHYFLVLTIKFKKTEKVIDLTEEPPEESNVEVIREWVKV